MVEQLVALVKDEDLQVLHAESLVANEVKDTAWGSDDNVGRSEALKHLYMVGFGLSAKDDLGADVLHELCESIKLSLDLMGEFSVVGEDEGTAGLGVGREVLEDSKHEDGGLAHSRDSLTEHIDAEDGLGDALLLDL